MLKISNAYVFIEISVCTKEIASLFLLSGTKDSGTTGLKEPESIPYLLRQGPALANLRRISLLRSCSLLGIQSVFGAAFLFDQFRQFRVEGVLIAELLVTRTFQARMRGESGQT